MPLAATADALLAACKAGDARSAARILRRDGSLANCADSNGRSPLYWASGYGHESSVRLLLKNGATIDSANSKGITPLLIACSEGHESTARLLLEKGASVNHADNDGYTALNFACAKGHESTVRLLLDNGASVNHVDNNGWTAMLYACHFKQEAVARLLARRGANVTKQVVDLAKVQGKRKLAKWLRRVYGHATSLHWACEDRDREGLLRRLRSDEYERPLPPLAELEAIATHKHAPACEQSVRLLRLAHEPWDVPRPPLSPPPDHVINIVPSARPPFLKRRSVRPTTFLSRSFHPPDDLSIKIVLSARRPFYQDRSICTTTFLYSSFHPQLSSRGSYGPRLSAYLYWSRL